MAIFRKEREKQQQRNGFWAMSWQGGEWSQLVPMESVSSLMSKVRDHGEPGRGRSTARGWASKVLVGRKDWTDTGDGDFLVQGGSGEAESKGIKREIGRISFDNQSRTVYGRALVGAEGQEISWEAYSALSAFSRNRNWMGRRPGSCGLWGDLK